MGDEDRPFALIASIFDRLRDDLVQRATGASVNVVMTGQWWPTHVPNVGFNEARILVVLPAASTKFSKS